MVIWTGPMRLSDRESDLRYERYIEQAEEDGCEICGGPVEIGEDRIFCTAEECGLSRRIPLEEFS